MKNQTKAILASTMILALALSSVAGATYSWFSDTEKSEFELATGTIDISASLKNVTTGSSSSNMGIANIVGGQDISYTYELIVTNTRGTVPALISAYVILERYYAYPLNENGQRIETSYGEIFAIYKENGTIDHFETDTEFYNSNSKRDTNTSGALTFDDGSKLQNHPSIDVGDWKVYNTGSITNESDLDDLNKLFKRSENTVKYDVFYREYYYPIGDLIVNSGSSSLPLYFKVNYGSNYQPDAVKELYVRTVAKQIDADCHATYIGYDSESSTYIASSSVEGTKTEVFLNSNIGIAIENDSLTGISKINVIVSKTSNLINVSIRYFGENNTLITTDPPGDLTIQFSYDELSGIIKAPASKLDYTISIGGSS